MEVCEGGDGARAFVSRVCTVAACPPTDLQCCTCHWLPPHPPSPCPAAAVLYFSIGAAFLPGHAAWATLLLWAAAQIGALLAWQLRLPRVIGMLGAGMVMTNVPWGAVSAFPAAWGRQMRAAALATIFLRCGLELDFGTMRRFKYPAVRLALLPGLVRCALCAVRRRCAVSCGLDERVRWGVALLRSALLCPDPPTHQPMRRRPRRFTTAAWASRCTTCRCCWPSPWASSSRRSAPASSCPPCSSCRRSGWAGTRVGGPGGRAGGRGGMGGMGGSARGRMVALEGSEGGGAALVRHRRPPLLPPPPAGIPSTVVIAASFDDIIAITGYSIFSSIAITGQGDVAWQIASGPLQARTRAPRCLCGLGSGDRRVASSTLDSRLDVLSSSVP